MISNESRSTVIYGVLNGLSVFIFIHFLGFRYSQWQWWVLAITLSMLLVMAEHLIKYLKRGV
jgi:hypothetical protein